MVGDVYPISVSALTLTKGDYTVLESISLTLEKGSFVALVGPSGCGKTSLLRVLALLDQPSTGDVRFWGHEVEHTAASPLVAGEHFYPKVTYVPQTFALWPHLTLRENALFATDRSPQVHRKLTEVCAHLEIEDILHRKPVDVSQGQRQRCALVRALLLSPTVLLLDEITASLDEDLAENVWSLLRAFAKQGGSILASTHGARLASACDYSYRIRKKMIARESTSNTKKAYK